MKTGKFTAAIPKFCILERSWIMIFLLAAGIVFLAVSCKSTAATAPADSVAPESAPAPEPAPQPVPESQPAAPAPGTPDQASLNALGAAVDRVGQARERAEYFESPARFPDEWDALDADYAAAVAGAGSDDGTGAGAGGLDTLAGVQEATAFCNALADGYDAVFHKAIPMYAARREDEVLAARDAAIAAGIRDVYPEYLLAADKIVLDAEVLYEDDLFYEADEGSLLALEHYQALKSGTLAYNMRKEIMDRDFSAYDADNFARADSVLLAAFDSYEAGDIDAALDGADEARSCYNAALEAGWKASAGEIQAQAVRERQKALDEKANVAVRADFAQTETVYNQASAAFGAKKYAEAGPLYEKAAASYTVLARTAVEKRLLAEEAIRRAEEKVADSESKVQAAEAILEGGEE
jgi:hypothetical protein